MPAGCHGEDEHSETKPGYTVRMYFVYILQSVLNAKRKYVGITDSLERRLIEHNEGKSIYTNKYKPWILITSIAFIEREKAEAFERYLKSHSGRAFSKKHF